MINLNEYQVFAFFYIIGIIISIVFDFFKALRKNIKHKDLFVYIEDSIYLLFCTILIFLGIFKLNSGVLRFYLIIALVLGILGYFLTISRFCVIIFSVIIRFIKNIITFILKTIKNFFYILKRINKKFIEYFIKNK